MVSLHVHVKRTGWKIRPRPKTVILKIKIIQNDSMILRSLNIGSSFSHILSFVVLPSLIYRNTD